MTDASLDHGAIETPQAAGELAASVLESSTFYSLVGTDPSGTIMSWNEGARRLYGYEPKEIVGRPKSVLHTAEDVDAGLPDAMLEGARARGVWEGTVERVRRDGTQFTARVVVTPRRGAGGRLEGFLLVSSDVTQDARLMRELQRTQTYSRSLLESAPDAMVIVDDGGLIQLANAETVRLFGYSRTELVGEPIEILIPERYRARHPAHVASFFRSPRVRPMGAGLELWGRRKDGGEFPVEISLSPVETDEGVLATAAIRDVTERKHAAEALERANSDLRAASEAKDRFLASMSHELRTPLNAILGFAGTLLMELPGPLTTEQRKQLEIVRSNGRHLLSLINDLLDVAKIESGKVTVKTELVACRELLEEVASVLKPLGEAQGIALDVVVPEEEIEVHSDRRALSQILINLANNAIKFTEEGGVRLELNRDGGEPRSIRFEVVDTGPGIAPEEQERLFTAFEQIDTSSVRPSEGTGLGLYISKRLANLIGGEISLESVPGQGATFILELPA
jgi:protein-histidine pros-kinase